MNRRHDVEMMIADFERLCGPKIAHKVRDLLQHAGNHDEPRLDWHHDEGIEATTYLASFDDWDHILRGLRGDGVHRETISVQVGSSIGEMTLPARKRGRPRVPASPLAQGDERGDPWRPAKVRSLRKASGGTELEHQLFDLISGSQRN